MRGFIFSSETMTASAFDASEVEIVVLTITVRAARKEMFEGNQLCRKVQKLRLAIQTALMMSTRMKWRSKCHQSNAYVRRDRKRRRAPARIM